MSDAITPEQNAGFIKHLTDILQNSKDTGTIDVLSQGYFFGRALAWLINKAEDPHAAKKAMTQDWLAEIAALVPELSGIVIRHPKFLTVLLFSDGSFIRTSYYNEVLLDEISNSFEHPAFETINADDALEFIAATISFVQDHGPLSVWAKDRPADLPDGVYINAIDTIIEVIEYDEDPLIDGMNMEGKTQWRVEEENALQEVITDAYLALNIRPDCTIDVYSSCDENETDGDIQISVGNDHALAEQILTPYAALVLAVVDLDDFDGHDWEYNDGDSERLSGYTQYPRIIFGIDFIYGDHSQHERLRATDRMLALLKEKGRTSEEIKILMAPIDLTKAA